MTYVQDILGLPPLSGGPVRAQSLGLDFRFRDCDGYPVTWDMSRALTGTEIYSRLSYTGW